MDLTQKSRFSKDEMALIRSTFGGNGEEILYKIRNVFLQFDNTVPNLSKEALVIVKKMLLPELDIEIPLGQQADNYISLSGIKEIPPDVADIHIQAKDLAVAYLKERFAILKGEEVLNPISLVGMKENSVGGLNRVISMMAYTFLVNAYIDSCLINLRTLSCQVEKTDEQIALENKANTNK